MDSKLHIDDVLNTKIRPIFEKVAAKLDALKAGDKVPATKLADEIAKEFGMTGPQLYPTLNFLFEGYPGFVRTRGAHGGMTKQPDPVPVAPAPTVDPVADSK